jgi:hypothetical protein
MQSFKYEPFAQGHPNAGFPDGCREEDLNRARLRVAALTAELNVARDELKRIEAARGIP